MTDKIAKLPNFLGQWANTKYFTVKSSKYGMHAKVGFCVVSAKPIFLSSRTVPILRSRP